MFPHARDPKPRTPPTARMILAWAAIVLTALVGGCFAIDRMIVEVFSR